MNKYEFTEEMGELSGMGGGYEQACRHMLRTGLEWFDKNPKAGPQFHGFKNIYGIIEEDNDDARALSKAVVDGSNNDCTGAMHQAVVSSVFYVRKNGWDKYVKEMSRKEKKT